ncbi:MAG: fumarylacetoacetate hydrolase family protein [Acidimicrobiales bacterium]
MPALAVAARPDGTSALVAASGPDAVDLAAARDAGLLDVDIDPAVLVAPVLNPLMAAGPDTWRALGAAAAALLDAGDTWVARDSLSLRGPVAVADYVDGYGGLHHATNMGRILRPGGEPLLANWRHVPVAYHGRAGTVRAAGTVVRPRGQVVRDGTAVLAETAMLDFELELGYLVGVPSEPGVPVAVDDALAHLFGVVLVDDWSARDVQSWEYQPLGPFLAKSFATTVSPWVTPWTDLEPFLVEGLAGHQDPAPLPYLRGTAPALPDCTLQVLLQSETMREKDMAPALLSEVGFAESMYWSPAQQIAHATVNGASLRVGDLFASGTVSGPDRERQAGSLMERTWGGTEPVELPTGESRRFVADGDRVVLRGWCASPDGRRMDLGEVADVVVPAAGS